MFRGVDSRVPDERAGEGAVGEEGVHLRLLGVRRGGGFARRVVAGRVGSRIGGRAVVVRVVRVVVERGEEVLLADEVREVDVHGVRGLGRGPRVVADAQGDARDVARVATATHETRRVDEPHGGIATLQTRLEALELVARRLVSHAHASAVVRAALDETMVDLRPAAIPRRHRHRPRAATDRPTPRLTSPKG